MELKFVVPNMEKTFGHLTYAGEGEVLTEGSGRNRVVYWSQLSPIFGYPTSR